MKRFIYTGVLGFMICFCVSLLYLANVVPWIVIPVAVKAGFICLSALYIPICVGVFVQILRKRTILSKTKPRVVTGFVLGMSIGLFVSGYLAVFGDHGLNWFYNRGYDNLLYGGIQEPALEQLRGLLPHAKVLGMLKAFIDWFIPCSLSFGLTGALFVRFFDSNSLAKRNPG